MWNVDKMFNYNVKFEFQNIDGGVPHHIGLCIALNCDYLKLINIEYLKKIKWLNAVFELFCRILEIITLNQIDSSTIDGNVEFVHS